ncbi:MAG: bifunctional riboflavin kinase/FAD synthetase [Mogibacterium sp.]|nr:bifunctional riboflavin kinase/FAD synthetase [Mogibacterium sp.]
MKIIETLDTINLNRPTVVALGNFDGVHIGHQQILREAVREARKANASAVCFTFSNHTRNNVRLICTEQEKLAILEALGIDIVVNVEFTPEIRDLSAEAFVREILHERLRAVGACCGFNYRFGAKASGTAELLSELGSRYGITVYRQEAVSLGETVVSSSYIRELIEAGELEKVSACLGRNYAMNGTVRHGNHLGSTIGFPTANILYDPSMMAPPNGVYYTYATLNGVKYPAVTNIGVKPTIGEGYAKSVETHIFGLDQPLYGQEILVEFLVWERPEMKFDGIDALKAQIAKDYVLAKAYHTSRGDL